MGDELSRLRAICLALPETSERASHGEATFFVRSKRSFVSVDDHHHGAAHLAFTCAAGPGVQEELVAEDPQRFYRPAYVGHRGWVGVRLEADGLPAPDWDEIAELVRDAYRTVAPRSLAAQV